MNNSLMKADADMISEAVRIIRGDQAEKTLNAAIIGGGKVCYNLLTILDEEQLSKRNMKILGVMDKNPEAPGLQLAKSLNLFTTTRLQDLYALEGLNIIIELTGLVSVKEEIFKTKPPDISVIDHVAAKLLWDLIQIETEKKELERGRQLDQARSKKHTQLILDSLPYRIMVVNMDMTVDTVNRTFRQAFNVTDNDVVSKYCYELRYGLGRSCQEVLEVCYLRDRLDEVMEKGFYGTYKEYQDEHGNTHYDVITIAPIYNEKGELVQILEASRDVTDRFKLEEEVRKSNTFLENVIKSTVDGIVTVDTKGNVLIFNEGMERLTGYSAQEVKHLTSFYPIDTARENMKKMRSNQYGPLGKLNPTSMTITTKHGEEIPVTLSASIITVEGKEVGSVGVFTDMREILQMRKDLGEAQEQVIRAEKLASLGKLAATIAHEINNPLAAVLTYIRLIMKLISLGRFTEERIENISQYLNTMEMETARCGEIVKNLLAFSRQSHLNIKLNNIEEIIEKSLNLVTHDLEIREIQLVKEIESDLPNIQCDFRQIQQVLLNLMSNASEAMTQGGVLTVTAKQIEGEDFLEVVISDTGCGIPKKELKNIFEPFFTTKEEGKGVGLGLSVVYGIITRHNGSIEVESELNEGSAFKVRLPIAL